MSELLSKYAACLDCGESPLMYHYKQHRRQFSQMHCTCGCSGASCDTGDDADRGALESWNKIHRRAPDPRDKIIEELQESARSHMADTMQLVQQGVALAQGRRSGRTIRDAAREAVANWIEAPVGVEADRAMSKLADILKEDAKMRLSPSPADESRVAFWDELDELAESIRRPTKGGK